MNYVEKIITALSRYLNIAGMAFLIILMLLITADVLLRAIFDQPIRGSVELAELVMVMTIFLALGWVQTNRANISVDILFERFPPKVKVVLNLATYLLCLLVCGLILWRSIEFQMYLQDSGRSTNILRIPVFPFQLMVVIGYFMLCIIFITQTIEDIRKAVKR